MNMDALCGLGVVWWRAGAVLRRSAQRLRGPNSVRAGGQRCVPAGLPVRTDAGWHEPGLLGQWGEGYSA